jgi:adenylosuccinate lyase
MLALVGKGVARETAYQYVQRNAMTVWRQGGDFADQLKADADIRRHLSVKEINRCFDLRHTLKKVEYIFRRVFGKKKP